MSWLSKKNSEFKKILVIRFSALGDVILTTALFAEFALNAMFVETVDTLVFVALTQYLIQSIMRCENSV